MIIYMRFEFNLPFVKLNTPPNPFSGIFLILNSALTHFSDNIPTIRLGTWPLNASMFDGEVTAGPCPVLFSTDIEASTVALAADISKSHYDLQRLSKAFFCHEDVTLKDALAVVKKPR